MSTIFLSGWVGFAPLFPILSKQTEFIVPFSLDSEGVLDEQRIVRRLSAGGETLLAWSMGAHMVLKQWRVLSGLFRHIVLVAPYYEFTSFVPEQDVRSMLCDWKGAPQRVMATFLARCGYGQSLPLPAELFSPLEQGLEYFLHSRAHAAHLMPGGPKVTLVHGEQDMLIRPDGSEDVMLTMHGARFEALATGHWVPERFLLDLL